MAEQTRILVVGGPQFVKSLTTVVAASGSYTVRTAGTIAEAQVLAREQRPAVAVLPFALADGDAPAACSALGAEGVPCLVVLSQWNEERRDAAAAAGAADVVGAPLKKSDINRRLRRLSGIEADGEQAVQLAGWASTGGGWAPATILGLGMASVRMQVRGLPDPAGMKLSVAVPGGDLVLWARRVGEAWEVEEGLWEIRAEFVGLSASERVELEKALAALRVEAPRPADPATMARVAEQALAGIGAAPPAVPAGPVEGAGQIPPAELAAGSPFVQAGEPSGAVVRAPEALAPAPAPARETLAESVPLPEAAPAPESASAPESTPASESAPAAAEPAPALAEVAPLPESAWQPAHGEVSPLPEGAFVSDPLQALPEAVIPDAAPLPAAPLLAVSADGAAEAPALPAWPTHVDTSHADQSLAALAQGAAPPTWYPEKLVREEWDNYSETEKAAFTGARPTPPALRAGLAARLALRAAAAEAKDLHPGMVLVDGAGMDALGEAVDTALPAIQKDLDAGVDQATAAALIGLKTALRREWAELREAAARLGGSNMAETMAALASAALDADVATPVRYTPRQAASAAAKPIAIPKIAPAAEERKVPGLVWGLVVVMLLAAAFHGYRLFGSTATVRVVELQGFPEVNQVEMDGARAVVTLYSKGLPEGLDLDALSRALAAQGALETLVQDTEGAALCVLGAGGQKTLLVPERTPADERHGEPKPREVLNTPDTPEE